MADFSSLPETINVVSRDMAFISLGKGESAAESTRANWMLCCRLPARWMTTSLMNSSQTRT